MRSLVPMNRLSPRRAVLVPSMLFIAASFFSSGCKTTVGGVTLSGRVGTRFPPGYTVEAGGELKATDPYEPSGDTFIFLLRGRY